MNPSPLITDTVGRVDSEMLACRLYTHYCQQVGGKAYDGKPLPTWLDFSRDPNKQVQVNAWLAVAKKAANLIG